MIAGIMALIAALFGGYAAHEGYLGDKISLMIKGFINEIAKAFGADPIYPNLIEEHLRGLDTDKAKAALKENGVSDELAEALTKEWGEFLDVLKEADPALIESLPSKKMDAFKDPKVIRAIATSAKLKPDTKQAIFKAALTQFGVHKNIAEIFATDPAKLVTALGDEALGHFLKGDYSKALTPDTLIKLSDYLGKTGTQQLMEEMNGLVASTDASHKQLVNAMAEAALKLASDEAKLKALYEKNPDLVIQSMALLLKNSENLKGAGDLLAGNSKAIVNLVKTLPKDKLIEILKQVPGAGTKPNLDKAVVFLKDNIAALENILGPEGLQEVTNMLSKGEIPDLSDTTKLLTDPKLATLRDIVLKRAKDEGTKVEDAIKSLKFDDKYFKPDEVKSAKLVTALLSSASDLDGLSNLDVLAGLASNPKALQATIAAVQQMTGTTNITTPKLSVDEAAVAVTAVKNMDFENEDIIKALAPLMGSDPSGMLTALQKIKESGTDIKGKDVIFDPIVNGLAKSKIEAMRGS